MSTACCNDFENLNVFILVSAHMHLSVFSYVKRCLSFIAAVVRYHIFSACREKIIKRMRFYSFKHDIIVEVTLIVLSIQFRKLNYLDRDFIY